MLDRGIVLLFLVICLAVGFFYARRQEDLETFALSNRRLGFWRVLGTMVSTISGFSIVFAHAIYGYRYGVSALWSPPAVLFAFLLFAWFSPRLKRAADTAGYVTFADMLLERFDGRTQLAGSAITVLNFLALAAINVYGIGLVMSLVLGWSLNVSILVGAGVVILYTVLGGFSAVVFTDAFQMVAMIGGTLILVPVALSATQEAGGLVPNLPAGHLQIANWGIDKIIGTYLVIIPVFFSSQDLWQRVFAAKDARTARRALVSAGFLITIVAAAAVVLGLCGRVLLAGVNEQQVLPALITELLPAGLVGLVLVSYLAAFTSSADSFLLVVTTALTKDVYLSRINPNASDARVVAVSRLLIVICGLVPVVVCLLFPDIVAILLTVLTWFMVLVPTTLAGFFWKKASKEGAFWSIVVGWLTAVVYTASTGDAETAGVVAVGPTLLTLIFVSKLPGSRRAGG